MPLPFQDRADAGRTLAAVLCAQLPPGPWLVLGLPRGGVPVAAVVAQAIGAELDCWVVRKLGAPGAPEYAVGAIAEGDVSLLDDGTLAALGLDAEAMAPVAAREAAELARRAQAYRPGRPRPDVRGRQVLLVDDGLATGATMRAAIRAVRAAGAARVAIAVPVASAEGWAAARREADDGWCPALPTAFSSVGEWYVDFAAVPDAAVLAHLASH